MKKQILFILAIVICFSCYSQSSFEEGYYIDITGGRVECLIKNKDWNYSPSKFEFRLTEDGTIKAMSVESVLEFAIKDKAKYISRDVKIDKSNDVNGHIGLEAAPIFEEEKLFLKVLIEGEASLYEFELSHIKRYFYATDNVELEQLVYKAYLNNRREIRKNSQYLNQLLRNLQCDGLSIDDVKNIEYKKEDLLKYFVKYNKCTNEDFKIIENKTKQSTLKFSIKPGIKRSSLEVVLFELVNPTILDLGDGFGFTLGFEMEYILPFNNNKWAVIIEPTYQSFNNEGDFGLSVFGSDYRSLEIPLGLRHYFFLNDKSKIFVNFSAIYDFDFNSEIYFFEETDPRRNALDINSKFNFSLGAGYKHNDKYSIEFRYFTNRDILGGITERAGNYGNISAVFGYKLFQVN